MPIIVLQFQDMDTQHGHHEKTDVVFEDLVHLFMSTAQISMFLQASQGWQGCPLS